MLEGVRSRYAASSLAFLLARLLSNSCQLPDKVDKLSGTLIGSVRVLLAGLESRERQNLQIGKLGFRFFRDEIFHAKRFCCRWPSGGIQGEKTFCNVETSR